MTANSQQYKNTEDKEISLKELFQKLLEWGQYFLSKWLIILIFGILGGSVGFLYAHFKKPLFIATTTFVLEDEQGGGASGLGSLAGLASIAGVDIGNGGGIFEGDNILELYKSRTMLKQTLLTDVQVDGKNRKLIERYIDFNGLKDRWAGKDELLGLNFSSDTAIHGSKQLKTNRLRDSIIFTIVDDITKNYLTVVKPDKKLSIIKVDIKSPDEIFAKDFNNAIVKNVNDFYLQTKIKKSLQNVEIIQHKTDSVRAVMNGAIFAAVAVADATPNLNPTRQVQRVVPAQRAQFSAETNKAILNSLVQNLEMSKMALMKETPLLEVIDQPVYPLQVERTGTIKGAIVGFLFFSLLILIYLTLKKIFNTIV